MRRIFLLLLVIFTACQNDEADEPEVRTYDAQQIASNGAVMSGEITQIGPVRPVNFGFLWDTQSSIFIGTAASKYLGGSATEARKFSIQVGTLTANTKYYYRSYAANADYTKIYYGDVVSFTTLP